MILPLAIVGRWPMEEYKLLYKNIEEALKHNVSDALKLYQEIELIKTLELKQINKQSKSLDKRLDVLIREKEERLSRLMKFSDYPAMTMAAYPEAEFMAGARYKRSKRTIKDPILIRGITTGDYAKYAEKNGRDYYFMETGYLGNYRSPNNQNARKIYHRIEKNNMQQTRIMDVPDDRWNKLCEFNPDLEYHGWKKNPGSKILLIMSTDKPFEFYGDNRQQWIDNTIATLKAHSDREIVIREKAGRSDRTDDSIYDALADDVWALVTYNSIAAVEAIQFGIPAFSMAPTAASAVSSTDLTQIENPPKPDEELIQRWLWSIAYGQFSLTELLTGRAWELVLENEQRPTLDY